MHDARLTSLTVVLPCHDEEDNVDQAVREASAAARDTAHDYEIVVVGTSWGGLSALRELVGGLPAVFSLPVVVVQHRHRQSDHLLASLLQDSSALPVSEVEEMPQLMTLHLAGDRPVLVYQKPDFVPATYTILNFAVPDVGKAAAELADRGVTFERYEGFSHDEDGVVRGMGPDIAWFKDPAGNVLSVVQQAGTTSGG